jgi:hypothetical protein
MRLPPVSLWLGAILVPLATVTFPAHAQLLWTVGTDDNGWPTGDGGGASASFMQENGSISALPGAADNAEANGQVDNDYYFTGSYTTVIDSVTTMYGAYDPLGDVGADEEAAERAFAGADNDMRYHFNLPSTLKPSDLLTVTFDALNLHTDGQADPRYGVEIYFNGVKVQEEILIRPAQLGTDFTTPQFTLASVNAKVGPGFDNIVSVKGVNYNADGGGNWMGIDYVQLNQETQAIPAATFPWAVGKDDNEWPVGDGGGASTTFVQENGVTNPLPGSPSSPETDGQGDNDYYFGGSYTTLIPGNGDYVPVGVVPANEESAERAFAAADNELRYHFNLPNSLKPTDLMAVTFDALNLHTDGQANPRYGVEIYFNGVRVQPEVTVRPADLNKPFTTPAFTLASVNAQVGAGFDNIVSLRGINYNADGGGNWMGVDYVKLDKVATPPPPAVLPWAVGGNDNAWPVGNGGGANATFVQENGTISPLPGSPTSPEVDTQADNDYYLAGIYTTVIPANGAYTPVGTVSVNEEAAERAFAVADNEMRFHFNLPANLKSTDELSVAFDALNLHTEGQADPRYGVEVYVNSVKVLSEVIIRPDDLNKTINTAPFTVASVNAGVGPGFDNIVTLKGINYNADGGGNWMGIDYIQLNPVLPAPFPWDVGRDDDGWPIGNGGGASATFVQEAGTNPLPGNPNSPEVDAQADDDYYFAGEYTKVIPSVVEAYGDYSPVGVVLVNEEAAERAFAGSDNDLRYHFNLPASLSPTDELMVTFDASNLHTDGQSDPRYGVEVYFNGIKVQEEIVIRPEQLGVDYTTAPFTLASVKAQTGPGFDNIVALKGISYSGDGGGSWMGIDYVQLSPMPKAAFPWAVGKDDNGWPVGNGGGAEATFVQEAGSNDLPGVSSNPEVDGRGDDDYYFAGVYTKTIPSVVSFYTDYTPLGIVPRNEEASERAFAATDNELRYHFNLPATLKETDKMTVSFDAMNLHTDGQADPRYGVEVYFNGVLVQPEILVRPADLDKDYVTPEFTLATVKAQVGPGFDNVVTLRGINYNADGGGNWMGIDYVQLNNPSEAPLAFLAPVLKAGKLTLTWTGTGKLESAPSVSGPWTPVTPAPASGYIEDLAAAGNRFYRLLR